MKLFIVRDNQEYGPYSVEDVQGFLTSGHVSFEDHARTEASMTWQTVGDLLKPPSPIPTPSSILPPLPVLSPSPIVELSPKASSASADTSQRDINRLANLSLIFDGLSLIFGCLSLITCFFILAISGVALGHMALTRSKAGSKPIKVVIGLVLGYFSMAVIFFLTLLQAPIEQTTASLKQESTALNQQTSALEQRSAAGDQSPNNQGGNVSLEGKTLVIKLTLSETDGVYADSELSNPTGIAGDKKPLDYLIDQATDVLKTVFDKLHSNPSITDVRVDIKVSRPAVTAKDYYGHEHSKPDRVTTENPVTISESDCDSMKKFVDWDAYTTEHNYFGLIFSPLDRADQDLAKDLGEDTGSDKTPWIPPWPDNQ